MLASTSRAVSRVLAARASPAVGSMLVQTRSYHENIVEHYENPRNVGSLDKNDESVGTVCCSVGGSFCENLPCSVNPEPFLAAFFGKGRADSDGCRCSFLPEQTLHGIEHCQC